MWRRSHPTLESSGITTATTTTTMTIETKPTHQAHHNLFDKVNTATFDARRKQQQTTTKKNKVAAAVVTTGPNHNKDMAMNILNKVIDGSSSKNHRGVVINREETSSRVDPVVHNKIDVNKITHEVRPHLIMYDEGKTKKLPITTINHGIGNNDINNDINSRRTHNNQPRTQ
jgi:hypothetical protein